MTTKPSSAGARSAAGNCWCRDRARRSNVGDAAAARGAGAAAASAGPNAGGSGAVAACCAMAKHSYVLVPAGARRPAVTCLYGYRGGSFRQGRGSARAVSRRVRALTAPKAGPISRPALPDRLTVRLRTLTPSIVVRIHVGHPLLPHGINENSATGCAGRRRARPATARGEDDRAGSWPPLRAASAGPGRCGKCMSPTWWSRGVRSSSRSLTMWITLPSRCSLPRTATIAEARMMRRWAFEDALPDDRIGDAGLVLQREEGDVALAGPLADQDDAGDRSLSPSFSDARRRGRDDETSGRAPASGKRAGGREARG
jgi:hypothetical protein